MLRNSTGWETYGLLRCHLGISLLMNDISFLLSAKDALTAEAYSEMLKKNGVDTITERLEPTGQFAALSQISSTGGSLYGSTGGSLYGSSGGPANNAAGGSLYGSTGGSLYGSTGGSANNAAGGASANSAVNPTANSANHAGNASVNSAVNPTANHAGNTSANHAGNASANHVAYASLSPAFFPPVNLYVLSEQLDYARDLVDEFDDSPVVFKTPAPVLNQKSRSRQFIFALVLILVFVIPIGVSLLAIVSRIIRAIK